MWTRPWRRKKLKRNKGELGTITKSPWEKKKESRHLEKGNGGDNVLPMWLKKYTDLSVTSYTCLKKKKINRKREIIQ